MTDLSRCTHCGRPGTLTSVSAGNICVFEDECATERRETLARAAAIRPSMPLTPSQRRAMRDLGDGDWHPGAAIGGAASSLHRMGLVERRGSSRTAKPSNPGYSYRLNDRGRALWEATDGAR